MIVLGLTGSMATGKSTVTRLFKSLYHIPVWDADAEVRRLLVQADVQSRVAYLCPSAVIDGTLNRSVLRKEVFENPDQLRQLEYILHPLLWNHMINFIKFHRRQGRKIIILDVPLLLERGWSVLCDYILVVSCKPFLQRQRILRRSGMTQEQMEQVLAQQLPQFTKKSLASFVVLTDQHKGNTALQLKRILQQLGVI